MTYPTKYTRQYDFQSYQVSNPTRPLPGSQVNVDLNAVATSVDELVEFLKTSIRADGHLANGSVGVNQLDESFDLGFSLPTTWEPGVTYTTDSTVFYADAFYKANVAHTSTAGFDESKWDLIVDFGEQATAAAASATASAASATAAAGSATAADGSADAAAASATAASNSATAASGSATTATTQATNASDSATAAATSETNAAASATAAATSATEAAASAASITIASQAEAEAGTENTKLMTPLRVAQSIAANGGAGTAVSVFQYIPTAEHAAIIAGTSTYDCTTDIQAAIDAADGSEVYLPAGTYQVSGALTRATSTTDTFKAGLLLRGAGMHKTTIEYTGASTDIGVLTLTTGDTSGLKFMLGAEITDLTIQQSGSSADVDAIRMNASWMLTIKRVQILDMVRHGIYVRPRTDININSDYYQDLYPIIEHCRINACGGWGVRFEAGNGAGPFFVARNQITSCVGGGFYTEVGQGTVDNNVITGCGTPAGSLTTTGGMIVDSAATVDSGPTPFGLRIIHNEFDTNNMQHLRLKSCTRAYVAQNRFISNVVSTTMTPNLHVALGRTPDSKIASNNRFIDNAHRCPTGSALAVYWYDSENSIGAIIENALDIGSGSGRVKYNAFSAANGDTVIEDGNMLTGPATVTATGTAVSLTTSTVTNITSISLPPGEWDLVGAVWYTPAASTSYTFRDHSISATSATHTATIGQYFLDRTSARVPTDFFGGESVGPLRVNVSTTTTYYLVARAIFTVSTMTATGKLRARRINR